MNSFFFFMFDEATSYTRCQSYKKTQGRYAGAMEMKSKLYLRIILLINYMMEENLFVYVECSVKHLASRFSVRKNVTKKKKERK